MSFLKKTAHVLLNPRAWWLCIIVPVLGASIAGTVYFMLCVSPAEWYAAFAYALYALSAVTLTYTVFCLIKVLPNAKRGLINLGLKRKFTRRLIEQYGFRTIVFACVSFAISTAYAAVNLTMGIIWVSLWYISLGAYYLMLSLMRGGVLAFHGRKKGCPDENALKIRETKTYLTCGIWLTLLPVALSFAVLEIVGSDKAFVRSGMMIYVAAAYTLYKVIMSVYNFTKARKSDEMTVRAIRNINLADALVSVLALQTAMFREFSAGENLGYANAATGAAVCAFTAFIGIFMTVTACLKIKELKKPQTEGNNG